MESSLLTLNLIMYLVIVLIVFLNVKILKLLGKYIQYVEYLIKMKPNTSMNPQTIKEIPEMKVTSSLDENFELQLGSKLDSDILFLFISPSCKACKDIYASINRSINKYGTKTVIVSDDNSLQNNHQYLSHFTAENITFIANKDLFTELKIDSVPYMILINKERVVVEQRNPFSAEDVYLLASNSKDLASWWGFFPFNHDSYKPYTLK